MKPPFDLDPYTITEVKGMQVKVEKQRKIKKRNLAKVKILKEKPERLLIEPKKESER